MKKTFKLHQNLDKAYALSNSKHVLPKIKLHVEQQKSCESFSCTYADGTIHVKAANDLSAVYGLHRAILGAASKHIGETVGHWQPRFSLRPLWMGSNIFVEIGHDLFASLPAFLIQESGREERIERFCSKLLELGYNSVIFGSFDNNTPTAKAPVINMQSICQLFHEFGVRISLKLHQPTEFCPLEESQAATVTDLLQELQKAAPDLDGIFWRGNFHLPECYLHPKAEDATQYDLARAEVCLLSHALPRHMSLTYYVPAPTHENAEQQIVWLPQLCNDLDNRTLIAFPAVTGDPWCDHLAPHPIWENLRSTCDTAPQPLQPIINIGSVRQGEGLWPCLTFDLIDRYLQRCIPNHLKGAIVMTSHLPGQGSLLECSLWTAGQILWKEGSAKLIAETWFAAKRPDLEFHRFAGLLDRIRHLTIDLSYFLSLLQEGKTTQSEKIAMEELRTKVESFLAELRHLQILFDLDEKARQKRGSRPLFCDYFAGFARDANRIVARVMQNFQITIPYIRREDDGQMGFWTQARPATNFAHVFLDLPQKGAPGSRLEQIYLDNYLQF